MKSYFNKEIKNLPTDKKLQLFASKMEDNSELFAQLEALLRGVPKQEVIDIDKKLIVQNFKYWSFNNPINSSFLGLRPTNIEISESSPLAKLGSVVCGIKFNINVKVHCCDVTAPVCYLFVRLCMESGIDRVNLFHKKEEMTESGEDFRNGCSAVVTEHSDIDSAIDVFLYSTSKRPWKLNHLFVQESEIERLKINLIAKSQLKGDSIENTNLASKNKIEIVAYENKLFAFDFIADADRPEGKQVVIVEAYRTVKELLTLIKKENPFFLSLWTNDISEANEIAYNVILPIVWINDYGIFGGPDRSSQAFYSAYFKLCYCIDKDLLTSDVLKNLQNWSKINTKERVTKILKVVEVLKADSSDVESASLIEDAVNNLQSNKFVDIENGRVCVGIEDFQGSIVLLDNDSNVKKVVTSLVYGAGCIRELKSLPDDLSRIVKLFQQENIPYMETDAAIKYILFGIRLLNDGIQVLPNTRVVYTTFGTIFAN
ncbi:uncharacterized protein LOC126374361 isoform X2 [Pectinophora gossypiella]|nr:uncharacterized protein LOC126374361 isoform X2 [Pectinophora gossypiella]